MRQRWEDELDEGMRSLLGLCTCACVCSAMVAEAFTACSVVVALRRKDDMVLFAPHVFICQTVLPGEMKTPPLIWSTYFNVCALLLLLLLLSASCSFFFCFISIYVLSRSAIAEAHFLKNGCLRSALIFCQSASKSGAR